MTTGTTIIHRAMQKLGTASVVSAPDPESVQTAFEALNSMIASWTAQCIEIDAVPLTVPGDDLGEKADATNAVILNLAVLISPDFDNGKNVVSSALAASARREFQTIKTLYQAFEIPKKVLSSTTPVGQGNKPTRYDETFFSEGTGIGN